MPCRGDYSIAPGRVKAWAVAQVSFRPPAWVLREVLVDVANSTLACGPGY